MVGRSRAVHTLSSRNVSETQPQPELPAEPETAAGDERLSEREGAAAEGVRRAAERRTGGRRKSLLGLSPALFLFPALIGIVMLLIYLFFVASAKDSRSVSDLLRDIRSGGTHSRKQDSYALSQKVLELSPPGAPRRYLSEGETEDLLQILGESSDDPELRSYLITAAGRAGQPAQTLPVLTGLLEDPDTSVELRGDVVRALGLSGSEESIEPILRTVRATQRPEDWELRWVGLWALVNLVSSGREDLSEAEIQRPTAQEVRAELRTAVSDTRREISWNSAFWLARYFRDDSGRSVLEALLDRDFLKSVRGDRDQPLTNEQRVRWMQSALVGLWRLDGRAFLPTLHEWSRDENLKVRNTALELLRDGENVEE